MGPHALRVVLALLLCLVGRAAAAEPTAAEPKLGDTASALPGIVRVGVVGTAGPRVSAAATAGYGYTEAVGTQDGANHRLIGTVAGGGAPVRWLELGLRLDGRFNSHPNDDLGSDDSLIGDPRLTARVGDRLADAIHLGLELVAWVPGEDAPSLPIGAITLDTRALAAWHPAGSGFTLAAAGGYRLDNSAETVPDPRSLRIGDRISLGLSEFDAVLLGLGASQRVGPVELLGEVTSDLLIGDGAPPLSESPLRATVGARYHLSEAFALEALADIGLNGRSGIAPADPLVPVEPRATLLVGARYRLGFGEPAPPPAPPKPKPEPKPKPVEKPAPPPPPPEPATGTVTGLVTDEAGNPLAGAFVTIKIGDTEGNVDTDDQGRFSLPDVAAGDIEVIVEVEGFDRQQRKTVVSASATAKLEFVMLPAVPAGQLRGLIRSFGGEPLQATVRVEPGGVEVKTNAEGRFEVDVPPGKYLVTIEAEGHRKQRRFVKVENRGVTIINADLKQQGYQ